MSMAEPTVYIDFLCPWAYRGAMWLADVEKAGRIRPQFRFFSLSQNHDARQGSAEPPIWERDPLAKGLPAFLAATAARAQGAQAGDRFRLALQRARHEDHLPVDDHATFRLVAEQTELDVARFERGGATRGLRSSDAGVARRAQLLPEDHRPHSGGPGGRPLRRHRDGPPIR